MKTIIRFLSFLALCLLTVVSCQENGEIGDLYGQWQLTSIEQDQHTTHPDQLYLAFQNDCVFARITGTDHHFTYQLTGGFLHTGNILLLNLFIDDETEGADVMHSYISNMFCFPEPHSDIRLQIEQLDDKNLVLSQGNTIWRLRSY